MVIPACAQFLDKNYYALKDIDKRLTEFIHREGINVRYLVRKTYHITRCDTSSFFGNSNKKKGLLRHWALTPEVKQLLLTEMVSRVIKIYLNRALRQQSKMLRVKISDVAVKQVIVDIFNLVRTPKRHIFFLLMRKKYCDRYWAILWRKRRYFGSRR